MLMFLILSSISTLLCQYTFAQNAEMDLLDNEQPLRIGERLSYLVIEERSKPVVIYVNSEGFVNVPLINKVYGKGRTCRQLAYDIKNALEVDFFHQATVTLTRAIGDNTRGEVTILGAVNRQGKYKIPSDKIYYVSDAIIDAAGGFLPTANEHEVMVIRKDPNNPDLETRSIVDVGGIINTGQYESDMHVEPDDTIIIPKLDNVGGQVYITGEVRSPGLYNIPPGNKFTVSRAILAAGGFTEWAKPSKVKLIREDQNLSEKERTITVNVDDILKRNIRDSDPIVQHNDVIKVPESTFF